MTLLALLILAIIVGIVLVLVRLLTLDDKIQKALTIIGVAVVVLAAISWLLNVFNVPSPIQDLKLK